MSVAAGKRRDAPAIAVQTERTRELVKAPARRAAPANQNPISRWRDHGKVRFARAERTGAACPAGQIAFRHDGVGRARQERSHRLHEDGFEPRRIGVNRRRAVLRRLVPRAEHNRQPFGIAAKFSIRLKSCVVERIVAAHRGCRRAEQEAQVAPFDRQVFEVQYRRRCELRVEVIGIQANRRQRHARLHTALQLEQLDLQVDGRREIGLLLLESPELGDLSRLGSLRWGTDGGCVTAKSYTTAGRSQR